MTYRQLLILLSAVSLVAWAIPAAAANAGGPRFHAVLSGAQEEPPVETTSSARALVFFDAGFTRAHVRIDLRGPLHVVAAHFHCARAGVNGPIAFGILNPGPLMEVTDPTRVTLTNEDFQVTGADCPALVDRPVNNIAALALAMRDGLIYINLHTPAAPGGEVRGQMLELGR